MGTQGRTRLKVLYDFEYVIRGQNIVIRKDERLHLLQKTNRDWWQVLRPSESTSFYVPEQSTFYIPAGYVAEVPDSELSDGTRFYIDKEAMYKSTEKNGVPQDEEVENVWELHSGKTETDPEKPVKEEKRGHDSFRNVIRKLSGNLNPSDKLNKPAKPTRKTKGLRKNSEEDDSKPGKAHGNVVAKSGMEVSAFGMCFGRDMKNDSCPQNLFQEELAHALVNRSNRSNRNFNQNTEKKVNQEHDLGTPNFNKVQSQWERAAAQIMKKTENTRSPPRVETNKETKSHLASETEKPKILPDLQNHKLYDSQIRNESQTIHPIYSVVDKTAKVADSASNTQNKPEKPKLDKIWRPPPLKPSTSTDKINVPSVKKDEDRTSSLKRQPAKIVEEPPVEPVEDNSEKLLNDKRKMWAIETLLSELIQAPKSVATLNKSEESDGPNQLAKELHEMRVTRIENVQVNSQEELVSDTKEKNSGKKVERVFSFPPRTNVMPIPKTVSRKSPKLLDEYNEANILSDNPKSEPQQKLSSEKITVDVSSYETPSYSNVSWNIKKGKIPAKIKIPTKDFREEMQLTPSLEKLANEIQFLPASRKLDGDKFSYHSEEKLSDTIASLSNDSLRLYKRCSKSDTALNRRDFRKKDEGCAQASSYSQNLDLKGNEKKYAFETRNVKDSASTTNIRTKHSVSRSDRVSLIRMKLNRKSRSLGDLDSPENVESDSTYNTDSRRKYRPVPLLRSKESLRRMGQRIPDVNNEQLPLTKPIPAKRRIYETNYRAGFIEDINRGPPNRLSNSCENLQKRPDFAIDIERSTAIEFKTLLQTSDSGSEEYLQYKTFPKDSDKEYEQIFRSDSNVNLNKKGNISDMDSTSRSLSDEMILSSTGSLTVPLSQSESDLNTTLDTSTHSSPLRKGSSENLVDLPPGWKQIFDPVTKQICFVNDHGDKWFSSNDPEGKIYFFEENSNESSWVLPAVVDNKSSDDLVQDASISKRIRTVSGDWPQLFDGNMCILKEGTMNRTKISENGKKLRKGWSHSYAVLTELFLLFFKDSKTFTGMKTGQLVAAKPDITVDLNGAFIESGDKFSNRRNVYLISTVLGLQVLIQWDSAEEMADWFQDIYTAIQRLPSSQDHSKMLSRD